ncbi:MAG TPA: M28 family peptidase [Pirellulales bacterium]|nr:M28 family peptidase [Pirellulales bacterium]
MERIEPSGHLSFDQPPPARRAVKRGRKWRKVAISVLLTLAFLLGVGWRTMFYMPGKSFGDEKLPPLAEVESAAGKSGGLALAEQLKRDVTRLAAEIGPRNLRRRANLVTAAEFVERELQAAAYPVLRQTYQVEGVDCWNVIAEIKGAKTPDEVVLVGAHYDSYGSTPGADDNASGTAALLALARRLATSRPEKTLRFVAFTNEEPPYFQKATMGSRVYARACRKRSDNLICVLALEAMGYYTDQKNSQRYPPPLNMIYPSTGNFIGVVGNVASRPLVHRVVALLRKHVDFPSEGGAVPDALPGVGWSDHWSFWQEGYQAVMITDTALYRNPHYHKTTDTPEKLNYDHLARVVVGVEGVLREVAGAAPPAEGASAEVRQDGKGP